MAYLSPWERLSEALDRVMAADGRSKEQAQTYICVAIAGRTINFQAKLRRHETKPLRDSVSILEGRDFHIPHKIKPEDLDWEQSRPLKPWPVKREDHIIHGRWYLEWIELCREEVSKVLCGGRRRVRPSASGINCDCWAGDCSDPGPCVASQRKSAIDTS